MLSVRELLCLCERTQPGLGWDDLLQDTEISASLGDFELLQQYKLQDELLLVVLHDKRHHNEIVILRNLTELYLHNVIEHLQSMDVNFGECIITGIGQGGWIAAELAAKFNSQSVVFGAPSTEKLPGKAINYVGEHDPVGKFTSKVVFVKQKQDLDAEQEQETSLYQKLEFDEAGNPIVAEQSEFSRFISWFYHSAGSVEPAIWQCFFPGSEEEAYVWSDIGVLSVYVQAHELSEGKLIRSIDKTLRYTNKVLEDNRNELHRELDRIPDESYVTRIPECTGIYAERGAEWLGKVFDSVHTILMGTALFTLDRTPINVEPLMLQFGEQISEIAVQEQLKLKKCLDLAISQKLERLLPEPNFSLEW